MLNIDTPALHFYMDLARVFMYNSIHAYGTEVNEMDEKDKRIKELEQQVAELNERIAFLTSKLFGKKTEKTRRLQEDDRQLDLCQGRI